LRVTCGACGAEENAATLRGSPEGFRLTLTEPWRAKNAKILGGVSGAMVTLCSDACEQRYGKAVGFFET
jgi:hypothetical protein